MATSGQFNGSGGYQGRTLQFAWTRTAYSISGCYSDVYWELRVVGGSSSYYYHYHEHCYINGTEVYGNDSRTKRYTGTIASGTWRFYHNTSSGACSFNVRLYGAMYTSSYNIDHTVTFTLDTIPRQANITGYISSVNDESNPWFTFSNPGGWNLEAWLEPNPNGTHYAIRTLSGTSGTYTWELTDEDRNHMRAEMKNSNSGKIRIGLYSNNRTWASYVDVPFTIVNAEPEFGNDPTYGTTNYSNLADDQTLIRGYSNLTVMFPEATAKKQASITSYKVVIGDMVKSASTFGTFDFEKVKDTVIKCYIEDSRGNVKEKLININSYVDYTEPAISNIETERGSGGIGTDVYLSLEASAWIQNFGKVTNSISISWFYKKQGESTWVTGNTALQYDQTEKIKITNQEIAGDLEALGFDNANIYDVRVVVTDLIASASRDGIISSGIPTVAIHTDGIALKGFYDEDAGGDFQREGILQASIGLTDDYDWDV